MPKVCFLFILWSIYSFSKCWGVLERYKNCKKKSKFFFPILYKIFTYGLIPVSFEVFLLKLEGQEKTKTVIYHSLLHTSNSTRGHLTLHCTGIFDLAYCFWTSANPSPGGRLHTALKENFICQIQIGIYIYIYLFILWSFRNRYKQLLQDITVRTNVICQCTIGDTNPNWPHH